MIISEIDLEIRVAPRVGAESLVAEQPHRWCVISIRGPQETKANLSRAKESVVVVFDDVRSEAEVSSPRLGHAQAIIEAAERFAGNPLLVSCAMGLSRSPAAALGILYFYAKKKPVTDPVDFSLNCLNQLGEFRPNPLLVRLMLAGIEPAQRGLFACFLKHPLWRSEPAEDLYSRLLPKASRE